MKKILFIIAICTIVVILFLRVFWLSSSQTNNNPEVFTDKNTSIVSIETIPKTTALPAGNKVTDITLLPEIIDLGEGMYSLNGTRSNPEAGFSLLYNKANNSYAIAILSKPIPENRIAASRYFLELLQTDEDTACSLNVYLGTVIDIDPAYTGTNLGLSFCPGSVQF
ncbi:MAG: hypothetical protein RLZZ70_43 [Candidatus Parcubacteria bacterium]|jgi:hypothetical protein